ncbi:MAG TPA: RNA 2',3'-cyclic phosphodiesterase [Gammaproteobacteria bacterium]
MASRDSERLFFALWPDPVLRDTIYKATRKAVRASGGKPVPPANFHVTLAFLGSLAPEAAAVAREAATAIRGQAFELRLDQLGFWPQPQVVWLGANRVPDAARRLAEQLASGLREGGLQLDPRPFVPHVTLARKVGKPGELGSVRPISWMAQDFVLVHSMTHPSGSEYSVLQRWPLAAA